MGAAKKEAVYIGDTVYDMDCAKGADVKFGLAFGAQRQPRALDKADFILKETRKSKSYKIKKYEFQPYKTKGL